MIEWRVYYSDGSTFSSADGSAYDAPAIGVQVIVKRDKDNGSHLVARCDYYWFDHGRSSWFGGDIAGALIHQMRPGPQKVCFGEYISNEEYERCVGRALADKDFPAKTARAERENF